MGLEATFAKPPTKPFILDKLQIKIETLKRLIRLSLDLNIIEQNRYLELETQLQIISKMTTGWQKYLNQKSRD
ncbi:MAG: four helix bundle protein [Candidatus Vogelbacteria bacterium]|nr:four helix bundle protein [Candidatus Vogelbacteria bacterium]